MICRAIRLALAVVLLAGPIRADAPETALRPIARPMPEAPLRPVARPAPGDGSGSQLDADSAVSADETPSAGLESAVPDSAGPESAPSAGNAVAGSVPAPATPAPATPAPVNSAPVSPDAVNPDAVNPVPPVTPAPPNAVQPPVGQASAAETPLQAPRAAPALTDASDTNAPNSVAPLQGPRQMVAAESFMQEPPPPMIFYDTWTGDGPMVRPATTGTATPETVADSGGSAFLRPAARPETLPQVDRATVRAALRPRARPSAPVDPAPLVAAAPDTAPVYGVGTAPGVAPDAPQFSPLAVAVSLRPSPRTARVIEQASSVRRETARGAICGNPAIQGDVISAIRDGGGCGIEEPVRVRSVGGVSMSTPAIMDCATASALLAWVDQSARPALRGTGGGLTGLQIMGSYACRPRNNQAGARLSEHGKGRAIDIGGFILASGTVISVLDDWGKRTYGAVLVAMHRDACGPFGTVLGPEANAFHRNHFHFDTASYRSGSYCR